LPVPPRFYGGIERIIDMVAQGLTERGHDVTIFAHRDSHTAGRLIPWQGGNSQSTGDTIRNAILLATEVERGRFDVVHSFSRLAYLTAILALPIPKIMSYQRRVSPRTTRLAYSLSRGTLEFTAISRAMMRDVQNIGRWSLIPNGVPIESYQFQATVACDAPLVFLGRVEEIKGPHLAIEVAKRCGLPLIIAGNIPQDKQDWFDAHIGPAIDGTQIRYIGPVDDTQKSVILGSARAFLMPILWDEPFGIVMTEALACGTPVLGLNRGSMPEIVEDGISGFVCNDVDGLTEAVGRIGEIDRHNCRRRVEAMYGADVIVDQYVDLYRNHHAARHATGAKRSFLGGQCSRS
jgi:glycosyltransferase involved in cell wall biosynthesis